MAQNQHATQKERVLRVLEQANSPIESKEVYDRLDRIDADSLSGVRGTLSVLKEEERVESEGDSPPYTYAATVEGDATDEQADEDDEDDATGLARLFDSVDEGEGPGTDDDTLEPGVSEEAWDALDELDGRISDLEQRLSATTDGGGAASLNLPVADRDADLDHATIIHGLGSRSKVRDYLRVLLSLPETTDSEQRAESEEEVEVVEKR